MTAAEPNPATLKGRWPRSLLGRNLLLIAVLMLLAQLIAIVLVRQLIFQPRITQVADGVARNVAALHAGLQSLPDDQRVAFVVAFNRRPAPDPSVPVQQVDPRNTRPSPLERYLTREVSLRLASLLPAASSAGKAPQWRHDRPGTLALRLSVEGRDYWLEFANVLPARELTGAWLAASLAATILAFLAAWLLQRRINQPLAQVVAVANKLALGLPAAPLPQDGPQEIAALSRAINHMTKSIAAAEHERALMLAGMSHDLRTPLTKLQLGLEIVRPQVDPLLATSMSRSIQEMDELLGQFLDYARAGEAEAPVTASLNDLAQTIAQSQAVHGRKLVLELTQVPEVSVRPQAMRRAVDNLVENAWRHGTEPVMLRTGCDARHAWIEVVDHGRGMTANDLIRLRQPFARGSDTARAGTPGAGLGLAIADRVARAHGGTLELESPPGIGLTARLMVLCQVPAHRRDGQLP